MSPFTFVFQTFSSEQLELDSHSNFPNKFSDAHLYSQKQWKLMQTSNRSRFRVGFLGLVFFSGRSSCSRQRYFALHYQMWAGSPSEGLTDLHWWNIATHKIHNYWSCSWYFSPLCVLPTSTDLINFSSELRSDQLSHRKPSLFVTQLPPMWFLCYYFFQSFLINEKLLNLDKYFYKSVGRLAIITILKYFHRN